MHDTTKWYRVQGMRANDDSNSDMDVNRNSDRDRGRGREDVGVPSYGSSLDGQPTMAPALKPALAPAYTHLGRVGFITSMTRLACVYIC